MRQLKVSLPFTFTNAIKRITQGFHVRNSMDNQKTNLVCYVNNKNKRSIYTVMLSLLLTFSYGNVLLKNSQTNIVNYTLSWNGESSKVKVNIKLPTLGKKEITLFYSPNPFDPYSSANAIENFSVAAGVTFEQDRNAYYIHNTSGRDVVEISYTLNAENTNDGKTIPLNEAMAMNGEAMVKKDYLKLLGRHFLLFSQEEDISKLDHSVSWTDVPSKFNTFDLTKNKTLSIYELMGSLYLFSEHLKTDSFMVQNIPHYILNTEEKFSENQAIIKNAVQKVMPETMRFFNDYDFSHYFVYCKNTSAIPKEDLTKFSNKGFFSAEAFQNGFLGTFIGEIGFQEALVVVHESIHRWLISLGGSFDHLWFNEGFTEYITLYTGGSSGFLDASQFEEIFNYNFKAYYTNFKKLPPENRTNKFIQENVRLDQSAMVINYPKGFIFAFYLDNKIRLASNGTKTIRDLMIDYNKERKNANLPFGLNISLETFEKLVSAYIPSSEVRSSIKKYIEDGDYINFNTEKLIEGISISTKEDSAPVFKFTDEKNLKLLYSF
ncbi:hypothetical protein [uncultured Flavobacterium sp.]|uniref:hypothetical protein n=1 Tax=uncultured Flavobacterium sp. TaxID=165435 RepID=UPI0030CA262B